MQWYSTQKYKPNSHEYLIRLQNKYNDNACAFVIAHYISFDNLWCFDQKKEYEVNYYITPTHFCNIHPVEIEKD